MVAIVLSDEQSGILNGASEPIEVRDASGRLVTRIKPPALQIPNEEELIAHALRTRGSNQLRFTSQQVQTHLATLEKAAASGASKEELQSLSERLLDEASGE